MARVYVSIGSNINPADNIRAALDALEGEFGNLALSSVYESEAVGFGGDNFYNMVVAFDTDMEVPDLSRCLRIIERDNGRRRDGPRFSSRTLDIDILLYDDLAGEFGGVQLPRDEILKNAFVLLPLAELAPEKRHPVSGNSYRRLWRHYDADGQKLWPIDFEWRGSTISRAVQQQ